MGNRVSIERVDNGWIVRHEAYVRVFGHLIDALKEIALLVTDWEQYKVSSTLSIVHKEKE